MAAGRVMLDLFKQEKVRVHLKVVSSRETEVGIVTENIAYEGFFLGYDKQFAYIGEQISEGKFIVSSAFRLEEIVFITIITDLVDPGTEIVQPGTSELN